MSDSCSVFTAWKGSPVTMADHRSSHILISLARCQGNEQAIPGVDITLNSIMSPLKNACEENDSVCDVLTDCWIDS